MLWDNSLYINCMLPFGLRSSTKIFTTVADALEWCIGQQGVDYIFHYLDDFLVLGPPNSDTCQQSLSTLERLCTQLGVPLAPEKKKGPAPVLPFLGVTIDTLSGELRLPPEKLHRLLNSTSVYEESLNH